MEYYVIVTWPEIQKYMDDPDFNEKVGFDCDKEIYYVPVNMIKDD